MSSLTSGDLSLIFNIKSNFEEIVVKCNFFALQFFGSKIGVRILYS